MGFILKSTEPRSSKGLGRGAHDYDGHTRASDVDSSSECRDAVSFDDDCMASGGFSVRVVGFRDGEGRITHFGCNFHKHDRFTAAPGVTWATLV